MQAKSKKDAKQLAAAALLEVMLEHVPFQDLLYKSDKQQNFKDIQVGLPASANSVTRHGASLLVMHAFCTPRCLVSLQLIS